MTRRTRLKDVAQRLNLSPALVSGVLNGRDNVWASDETRARILEAATLMNYQPSAAAQALSKGKTDTVAFVYRRLEGSDYRLAYSGLVDVLSSQLQEKGYGLVVANFGDQEQVLDYLRKLANSHSCDAVVLWGREADTEAQGELLEKLRIPFLVKGRHEKKHPKWYQIDFDHEDMMRKSLEELVKLGHKRIGYLGFPLDEAFVHCLREGFISAHQDFLGSAPDPRLIGQFEDIPEKNAECIARWLTMEEEERPTAFVIGSGNAAWHAVETCLARIGHKLGKDPSDYAAAGITSLSFTLMFGDAVGYQGIEIDNLARYALPGLLEAILRDENANSIQRFSPELSPLHSLNLLEQGVRFNSVQLYGDGPGAASQSKAPTKRSVRGGAK